MSTDEQPDTKGFDDAANAVAAPREPTFPVSVGARALHKSEAWYPRQLKAGTLPGHRAGRTWFLTAADIAAAIEYTRDQSRRHAATAVHLVGAAAAAAASTTPPWTP